MTDEAFLQAVAADPDDDGVRLVYADWLDETGQPERAEFIRGQCLLATLAADDPRRDAWRARCRILLRHHGRRWLGPLDRWVRDGSYRRGFLEAARIPAGACVGHLADFAHVAPVRRFAVDLAGFRASPAVVARVPRDVALNRCVTPLGLRDGRLIVAVTDPGDLDAMTTLTFACGQPIEPVAASMEQIASSNATHYGERAVYEFIDPAIGPVEPPPGTIDPLSRLVAALRAEVQARGAAEVHVEVRGEDSLICLRFDEPPGPANADPWRALGTVLVRVDLLAGTAVRGRAASIPFKTYSEEGWAGTDAPDGPRVVLSRG